MGNTNYPNYGYLFYYDYYNSENNSVSKNNKAHDAILNAKVSKKEFEGLQLKTIYPGLVLGTGYTHNLKGADGFKIGFYFDHTSGLPVIPGASIKGALRNAFPGRQSKIYKNPKNKLVQKRRAKKIEEAKYNYMASILPSEKIKNLNQTEIENLIDEIELEIFEGKVKEEGKEKKLPTAKRDTFFNAEIIKGNKNGEIFGDDYITHHKDPLKNPTPLMFLKILPNVTWGFNFKLHDGKISAKEKEILFEKIILYFGLGAKTNLGYGQFE
ncbi:type III-B CRISPR module RAMP protein Cmr6 [Marinifilum sp. D737]|nr:type III-B CRISPR module RAMP protein Cmr6 [Marinifilum sp. D737]MCY1634982.1 type III-B CRISPR module RAMP protein Cmr6 [Marinifilum sp. D737]